MNELIEELFETYTYLHEADNSQCTCIEDFTQAIQTACKAQRNACARHTHYKDDYTLSKAVETARIEREDYE